MSKAVSICVDTDEAKINTLCQGGVPIHERHVPELLAKHLNRSVTFTSDLATAVAGSEAVFIAVGTPQQESGATDLSSIETVVSEIAPFIKGYKVIVEKSTVPVYTNEWIHLVLQRHGVDPAHFDVVSNPEFLREGTAVTDFLHPDRIVIGSYSARATALLQQIYEPLTSGTYYGEQDAIAGPCTPDRPAPLLITSAQSAELIKHAANAFLALKISFINTVANLAEAVDADIEDIAAGMGLDSRIGPQFLRAGIGFGGSSFPRDVEAFRRLTEERGVDFQILDEIGKINSAQKDIFFKKVLSALWTLRGKHLAALGLSYKGETDDIRESPAVAIIERLLEAGAFITAYDSAAMERAKELLPLSEEMSYASDLYEAANGADAVLILTDWNEFAEIDLDKLKGVMRSPIVIDGRNLYKPEVMFRHGFTYISMGRPACYPSHQAEIKDADAAGAVRPNSQRLALARQIMD